MIPSLCDQSRRHVATASSELRWETGSLLVIGNPDGGALDDESVVQAVGLCYETSDGTGRVGVAVAAVHLAVVVLLVQPPETAIVGVLLDDGKVSTPDGAVNDTAASHVGCLGSHGQAEVGGHLSEDTVDDADQVGLGGGQCVDVA